MKFMRENWGSDHILANNIKFMNWQHYSNKNNRYNFLIATDNSKIIGCHGFISHSHFSEELSSNDTVWLVNWFAIRGSPNPGLDLVFFPLENLDFKRIGSIGCNATASELFKALGFTIGELNHYFAINPNIINFTLIAPPKNSLNPPRSSLKNTNNTKLTLNNSRFRFDSFGKDIDELVERFGKNETFFINRYIRHPYYKYQIYWIYSLNKSLGFFVTRICKFENKKALRIVDFFGHDRALIGINVPLEQLLVEIGAEYVDFYEYAIADSIMSKSGLHKNKFNDQIIVPNYFEPFVKRNIILRWAIKINNSTMAPMFKGDGDQDRPNIVQE